MFEIERWKSNQTKIKESSVKDENQGTSQIVLSCGGISNLKAML